MRILLFGEYSNLHATLAQSFRRLGHNVTVISDGDHWRNYRRDIDLTRHNETCKIDGISLILKLIFLLPRLRNFDVVQIINPKFLPLKARFSRLLLKYLKRHNNIISMGCFGMDSIVLRRQNEGCLEYSDTYSYGKRINDEYVSLIHSWLHDEEIHTTESAAMTANCLMACLYEYYTVYNIEPYRSKLFYLPLPISIDQDAKPKSITFPINVLVGVQRNRIAEKGIDQILPLLERFETEYPDKIKLQKVESVPFAEYKKLIAQADVIVDQLYSYTPAMNALEAMKNGTIAISGGEEDYYRFIGENELRPIINLRPFCNEENYRILKSHLLDLNKLNQMSAQSIEFIKKYHDSDLIARKYIEVYSSLCKK